MVLFHQPLLEFIDPRLLNLYHLLNPTMYGTTESSKVDIFLLVATLGAQHHHERDSNVFLLARMQCHDSTKSEIPAN